MAQLVSAPMRLEFCRSPGLAFAVVSNQWNPMVKKMTLKTLFIPNEFGIMMVLVTIALRSCFIYSGLYACISVPVRFLPVYKAYKVYTLIEGGSCLNPPFRHKMLPGPCDWMYCGGNSIGNGNKPAQAELLIRLPMVLVVATFSVTLPSTSTLTLMLILRWS